MVKQPLEQVGGLGTEEAIGGSGAIWTLDEEVVHGGQGLQATCPEAVQAVVQQRKVTVAAICGARRSRS